MKKVSTESYKGVRDFYPEDQFIQRYLFEHMERVCELYGYEEYNASILEPTELYRSKTSEEIVNDETYSFIDRGDREVTLRPEMTPTVARMLAARSRDIPFPARWYSIQNFFRYQKPQHGRLREFWQLNADLLGHTGIEADAEVIAVAHNVLRSLGAEERDFEVHVSDRRLIDGIYDSVGIETDQRAAVTRLLDRRAKIRDFAEQMTELIGDSSKAQTLIDTLDRTTSSAYLEELRAILVHMGVGNLVVDTKITRGFDYYTGMIFEIFDTDPVNPRAIAGGGRYDNLLSLFGNDLVPAVGFGFGDVTLRDFLAAHDLLPNYTPATEIMLAVIEKDSLNHALKLAQELRREDICVAVNFSGRRIGDQIRMADKAKIPFVIALGSDERTTGRYTLKNLATGAEITLPADRIAEHLFGTLGQ